MTVHTHMQRERDDLSDKVRSLQANLDNCYKEMSELQKANAVNQSAAQEAALDAERSAREELMSLMEQQKRDSQQEKERLLMEVNELRMSMSRTEQQATWREDHLRQEIADMQQVILYMYTLKTNYSTLSITPVALRLHECPST